MLRLCDGTACHVKRSEEILKALRETLGLSEERPTSADRAVHAGDRGLPGRVRAGAVMVVGETVHGLMTPEKAVALVEEIREKERGTDDAH